MREKNQLEIELYEKYRPYMESGKGIGKTISKEFEKDLEKVRQLTQKKQEAELIKMKKELTPLKNKTDLLEWIDAKKERIGKLQNTHTRIFKTLTILYKTRTYRTIEELKDVDITIYNGINKKGAFIFEQLINE